VDDFGGAGRGRAQCAVAALAVRDALAGQTRDDGRQYPVAESPMWVHEPDRAGESRPDDVVGGAVEDRCHHALELLGCVLTVGIAERDRGRVERHRFHQAPAHCGTQPRGLLADDARAGTRCSGDGAVA
jgi:hypothetical protein